MPTEPAHRWEILTKAVLQIVAIDEDSQRHAIQVQSLMGHIRHAIRVRSSTGTTGTTGTTRRATNYPKEPATCIHQTWSQLPTRRSRPQPATNTDPIQHYKNRGRNYRTCRLCGTRWLDIKGWLIPLPPYPAPGQNPKKTDEAAIGEIVLWFGTHKEKKIKDIPAPYQRWATEQLEDAPPEIGRCLSFVAAYAALVPPPPALEDQAARPVELDDPVVAFDRMD